jgi:hypothetical protein
VLSEGLATAYRNHREFNHPPLMGLYAAQAWSWAAGDLWTFARLIKLSGLAGEAITLIALWRFAGPPAFAAYACMPAAILVSGFHANTDCLYAAFVLLAVLAFERKRHFLSGVLWSLSLNVKLLPLVLIPMIFIGAPNVDALARLFAGFAVGMTPFLPPVLVAASAMSRNMLAYNSLPENWGLIAFLNRGIQSPRLEWSVGPFREWWLANGGAGSGLRSSVRSLCSPSAVPGGFAGSNHLRMHRRDVPRDRLPDVHRFLGAAAVHAGGLVSVSGQRHRHDGVGSPGALHVEAPSGRLGTLTSAAEQTRQSIEPESGKH